MRQVEWRELVERFESPGATGKAFAARYGVNVRTLRWWRSYVRREARERGTPEVRLVELHPVGAGALASGADSTVLVFAGGMRIRVCAGFDPATLSAVLKVVEAHARGAR